MTIPAQQHVDGQLDDSHDSINDEMMNTQTQQHAAQHLRQQQLIALMSEDEEEDEEYQPSANVSDDEMEQDSSSSPREGPQDTEDSMVTDNTAELIPYAPLDIEGKTGVWKVRDFDENTATWRWKIENLSQSKPKIYSPTFDVGGYPWRLLLFPKGNQVPHISLYLDVFDAKDLPQGWTRYARFNVAVLNQKNIRLSNSQDAEKRFNAQENDWGFREFMPLSTLYDPNAGFIVDDTMVLDISINVCKEAYLTLPSKYDSRTETGFVGLKNQGATCYLNSLLQTLYHLAIFRKKLYLLPTEQTAEKSDGKQDQPNKVGIGLALQRAFYRLQNRSNKNSVETRELTRSFGWDTMDSFMQHDIQELARVLCDNLETKFNQSNDQFLQGTVEGLFKGKLLNYIKCVNVQYESTNTEAFYDLQLTVKDCANINESFDKYISVEMLEGDNQYNAEGHGMQDAKRGCVFQSFPPVLMLHLARFEYDVMRDCMAKINDKYQFNEEINLNKYLEHPSENEDDNTFILYSVLVHSGDVHGGHYYAFVKPYYDDQTWYKFDDERVYKVSKKEAVDDNFGGEEEHRPIFNFWGNTKRPNTVFKKFSNAYMLVYVRKKDAVSILQPVTEEEVPDHLKKRFEQEREEEERKRQEKAEAHKYVGIRIATDADIKNNQSTDLARVDLVEPLKVKKSTLFGDFKKLVEEKLGVPAHRQRYWKWEQRQNRTMRPDAVINAVDSLPLERVFMLQTHTIETLNLYLEVPKADEQFTPLERDSILIFFKYYDPEAKTLEYVGNILVRSSTKISDAMPQMCAMAGLEANTALLAFEEVRPSMIEPVDPKVTFKQSELQNGDIIAFQAAPDKNAQYEYPKVPDFYNYLLYRTVIKFCKLESPKEVAFTLELLKNMSYETVTQKVGEALKTDPLHVRLTGLSPYGEQQARSTPFKTTEVRTLKDMIVIGQITTDTLFFEILEVPIVELESKKALTISIYNQKVEEVNKEKLLIPKEYTVAHALQSITESVKVEATGSLRLLEVVQHKIQKILPFDERVEFLHDYPNVSTTLRAEEVSEEEMAYYNEVQELQQNAQPNQQMVEPERRMVQVQHFQKDHLNSVRAHGAPFYFVIKKGETAAVVRERIRQKLGVEKEEFEKWKFATLYLSKPEYINDEDIVYDAMKKVELYRIEATLGLEHKDTAPRHQATQRWYDKPIKIYN